ncbi:signal transduction histidine kinase [Paenibacillus anaericanus]|uniref:HAMP domain-containing sensor histidine kinase n=1 Tax=Paenibacillus anaericanus TaxID=170367 RepID=UPI002781E56B|nr:HAMP domain-containing sensor histidine kinase [Paenibacillus anaericanus]MDQ0086932.1 signal transduction histidine kinase [Paenibacillus anaericanus]
MDRIKRIWFNLSIQKTLIVYTVGFMLLATVLSSLSFNGLDEWKNAINKKYVTFEYSDFTDAAGRSVRLSLGTENSEVTISQKDEVLLKIIDLSSTLTIPVFFGGCIILAAYLFYRNKLKKPIELINQSAAKIAEHDLDFSLRYESKDEMGRLCASLETMRSSLENNYREMWRMMEERKRLNAVFAHDLRTPLTVLRGYSDFLSNYIPHHKVSEEKLLSTVFAISKHTERIENYVATMNDVQKLEDISIYARETNARELVEQITSTAQMLGNQFAININVVNHIKDEFINVDPKIVLRVIDNLLSNALRFAKGYIEITLQVMGKELIIEVSDDGCGFSHEDLKQGTKAFYRTHSEESVHFGLGLYICKTLCEKHGGEFLLSNNEIGGAKGKAKFDLQKLINN